MNKPVLFLLALFYSLPAMAETPYSLELSTDGQVRDDESGEREIPSNNYFGFSLNEPGSKFWLGADMRFFHDFEKNLHDYDLYQATVHFRPKTFQADLGRQMVNQGFTLDTLDGAQITFTPLEKISVSLYSGVPRTVEIGDFNKDDGLSSGVALALTGVAKTRAGLKASWKRNNSEDRFLIGADVGHDFGGKMMPFGYALAEFNATGQVLETATAGFDLYPSRRMAFNFTFDYFDVDRDDSFVTFSDLYTRGGTYSGRVSPTLTLLPGKLDFTPTYAYQSLDVQDGSRDSGHLFSADLPFSYEKAGFHATPAYYFMESFGGRVHGGRLDLREDFTSRIYAQAGVDYSRYVKITGNDDDAFSTFLWSGVEPFKGLLVSAGFEYNVNNLYDQDIRGMWKVDYELDAKLKK